MPTPVLDECMNALKKHQEEIKKFFMEYSYNKEIKSTESNINIKLLIKREYKWKKKKVIVPYINGLKYGEPLYIENPFTAYVQYGVWKNKYPAKMWIE